MKLFRSFAILALIYMLLGPILLFGESMVIGAEATKQALPITIVAVCFFAYNMLMLSAFERLLEKRSKSVTGFYLINNVTRLILSVIILVIYAVMVKQGLLVFAINLAIYYLVTVIFTCYHCVKKETYIKSVTK